ncbi:MAG: hypothetical protein D084_Lepto4C00627G0005 [Leptospirillum sp. Group IV 'UBA BS']|jgi:hypothetical protein|nr:MAG: hypothetical protein D084_Lepto4C00627G0005 [Leptospirillum sp. Group IV 'UBA BS']
MQERSAKETLVILLSGTVAGTACHLLPAWLVLLGIGLPFCLTTSEALQETFADLVPDKVLSGQD